MTERQALDIIYREAERRLEWYADAQEIADLLGAKTPDAHWAEQQRLLSEALGVVGER